MLIGLPLLGVFLSGRPLNRYLEFPPTTHYIRHALFLWPVFWGYAFFIVLVLSALIIKGIQPAGKIIKKRSQVYPFPWWGWFGLTACTLAWVLAWNRFPWFKAFQPHTFVPLWLSFILVINAMVYRRKGDCTMLVRPGYFLILFPASAAFWWFFEYLNRFVQNWYYVGAHYPPWEYFWLATLSFSTVLPAFLGLREWVSTFSWTRNRFQQFPPLNFPLSGKFAGCLLLLSGAGLTGIGVWPNYLFSLLWISPLLIIVAIQILSHQPLFMKDLSAGDWRPVVSSALAALLCGGFWELWNYHSLAKWEYSIPFVHRFQIFEMPLLGYAGYIPFGLECLVVLEILDGALRPGSSDTLRYQR